MANCTFRLTIKIVFYVYVLQSLKDGSLYVGYTSDLKKRFESHNLGRNKATKIHIPYKIIFYEAMINRVDAKNREVYLKSGWGLRSINKILDLYFKDDVRIR